MKALQAQHVFVQQIPVERLQMPYVKNDAVTLRNGTLVHRVRTHNVEECVTAPPRIGNPRQQLPPAQHFREP